MPYCTSTHVENIIAQALTSANPSELSTPANLLKIGHTLDTNQVPSDIVDQYIEWGSEQIDATISELYKTPVCPKADAETTLYSSIGEYNDYIITEGCSPFVAGDTIVLYDGVERETHTVLEVIADEEGKTLQTVLPIIRQFQADVTRVVRVKYPSPLTLINARLAAANIYDKYFSSQSSPNVSDYGKFLRELATQELNNILSGVTILHGAVRIGNRFLNSNIRDQYGLPSNRNQQVKLDSRT